VSSTTEIKIVVLEGCSPAGRLWFATWVEEVLPTGMSLRGLEKSDVRHGAASLAAGLDRSELFAMGLIGPPGLNGAAARLIG
jgi:hypothetical protein